jgi:hypothetical protein
MGLQPPSPRPHSSATGAVVFSKVLRLPPTSTRRGGVDLRRVMEIDGESFTCMPFKKLSVTC